MGRAAARTKDDAQWVAREDDRKTKAQARADAKAFARSKSFNAMTRAEKDEVLLLAAKMLGIIEE